MLLIVNLLADVLPALGFGSIGMVYMVGSFDERLALLQMLRAQRTALLERRTTFWARSLATMSVVVCSSHCSVTHCTVLR